MNPERSSAQNEDSILEMSSWDFDHSPDGWRKYGPEERLKAVALIRRYIAKNEEKMKNPNPGEQIATIELLNFHIGQLLASEGEERRSEAIDSLRKSFMEDQECWNTYVSATIGFLEGDEKKIDDAIRTVELSTEGEEWSGNLGIIRNFKKALQMGVRDYDDVYSWPRK